MLCWPLRLTKGYSSIAGPFMLICLPSTQPNTFRKPQPQLLLEMSHYNLYGVSLDNKHVEL